MTISRPLRPREKIQQRSVRALSDHELIQAIIGNGSGGYSVKYLSRIVLKLSVRKPVEYEDLIEISGLGSAKAARLAASYELARRHNSPVEDSTRLIAKLLEPGVQKHANLALVSLDGAKRVIRSGTIAMPQPFDGTSIQTLCRWLVLDNAIYAIIGTQHINRVNSTELCRLIYRAFQTIGVQLLDFKSDANNGESIYAEHDR